MRVPVLSLSRASFLTATKLPCSLLSACVSSERSALLCVCVWLCADLVHDAKLPLSDAVHHDLCAAVAAVSAHQSPHPSLMPAAAQT